MKFKLLSVFYTLHRCDGGLAERFMHLGGLGSLASLLGEENAVIQSQAMELLTDFLQPFMAMPVATGRQQHLLHQVFRCLSSSRLWRNCAQILSQPGEARRVRKMQDVQAFGRKSRVSEAKERLNGGLGLPPQLRQQPAALSRCNRLAQTGSGAGAGGLAASFLRFEGLKMLKPLISGRRM